MDDAALIGRGGFDGQLEGVEGVAGVAAGDVDQVLDGILVDLDGALAVAALGIGEGTLEQGAHVGIAQGAELEDTGAGDQGADDLEVGVLGGGADEGEGAVLDMGQEGVLLGLVPAVDLVDEEDGLLLVEAAALEGFVDDITQLGFAGQHGGEGLEVGLGLVGDDHGEGGLAGAGRPPEEDGGEEAVGLDGAAEQLAGAEDVLLPDELVEGARAHAGGERGFGAHALLVGVGEEVHIPPL